MTSIKLTENHKSKLLEMCKELFPEYVIYPADNDGFIEGEQWVGDQNMGEDRPVNEFNIHWFEFCMTHLIVKLSKEFTKQKLSEADYTDNQYPNWFSEKVSYHLNPFRNEEFEEDILFIHPVDYLYEEFKKLK